MAGGDDSAPNFECEPTSTWKNKNDWRAEIHAHCQWLKVQGVKPRKKIFKKQKERKKKMFYDFQSKKMGGGSSNLGGAFWIFILCHLSQVKSFGSTIINPGRLSACDCIAAPFFYTCRCNSARVSASTSKNNFQQAFPNSIFFFKQFSIVGHFHRHREPSASTMDCKLTTVEKPSPSLPAAL